MAGMKFNKMFIMVPVMLAARKLDGDDPHTVQLLRMAYGVMQGITVLVAIYVYLQASKVAAQETRLVYVPPPQTPFADPEAKKKYTEITYGAHVLQTARSLLGSTIFGILLTCGLHYWKGMVMGLAIQAIMAPFSLAENAIVWALFMGNGIRPEDKIFEEKTANELKADDEVVDPQGNPVVRQALGKAAAKTAAANKKDGESSKSLEEILLDTWDAGTKADLEPLLSALNKKNVNTTTSEDHWTALMILAGGGSPQAVSAIRQVLALGGDPALQDVEGWNCLHWAAFHGNATAAKELASKKECKALLTTKDKEGNTPVDMARKEGNNDAADVLEAALGESKKSK